MLKQQIEAIKNGKYVHYATNKDIMIKIIEKGSDDLDFSSMKITDVDTAYKAINHNGINLKYVMYGILNYDMVLKAIQNNGLVIKYIINLYSDENKNRSLKQIHKAHKMDIKTIFTKEVRQVLPTDKQLIIEAVKQNGVALKYVNNLLDLETDYDTYVEAIKNNINAIQYINFNKKPFRKEYIDLILYAVRKDGLLYRCIRKPYRYISDIVYAALNQNVNAFKYVAKGFDDLIDMPKININKVVSINGLLLKYVSEKDITYDIIYNAVNQNPNAILYALKYCNIANFKNIMKLALRKDGLLIKHFINCNLVKTITHDLIDIALEQNPQAVKYCKYISNDTYMRLLEKDGMVLQYIQDSNAEMVTTAVRNNGKAIQYAHKFKQDFEIVKIAVENNGFDAIKNDIHTISIPSLKPLLKKIDNSIYCNNWLYSDAKEAIMKDPRNIDKVPNFFLEYYDDDQFLRLTVVKYDGTLLKYFISLKNCILSPDSQKNICMQAVKQNGLALQYTAFKKSYDVGYENFEETTFRLKKCDEIDVILKNIEEKRQKDIAEHEEKKIKEGDNYIITIDDINSKNDKELEAKFQEFFGPFYDNFTLDPQKHFTDYDRYIGSEPNHIPNLTIKRYSYNVAMEYEANYQDQEMCDIAMKNTVYAFPYVNIQYITLDMCKQVITEAPHLLFLITKQKRIKALDIIFKNIIILKQYFTYERSIVQKLLENNSPYYYCVTDKEVERINAQYISIDNLVSIISNGIKKSYYTYSIVIDSDKQSLFYRSKEHDNSILIHRKPNKITIYSKHSCEPNNNCKKHVKIYL